jgi:hypothetical protein
MCCHHAFRLQMWPNWMATVSDRDKGQNRRFFRLRLEW